MIGLSVNLHGAVPSIVEDYADIPGYAVDVEAAGVSQVVAGDMLLLQSGARHSGAFRFEPDQGFLEPLAALAVIAGATTRLRVSTGILVAPLRHPVVLARSAGTIDLLSGGRLDLVVAAGWNEVVFDAMGVPFEERFARLDEAISLCRALWEPGPTTFEGRWARFEDLHGGPVPTSSRIWLGARATRAAARRVARSCDGWAFNSTTDLDAAAAAIDLLEQECDLIGRDPASVELRATAMLDRRVGVDDPAPLTHTIAQFRAAAERCAELRVGQLVVLLTTVAADRGEADDLVRAFVEELRGLRA